jgi:hypothetical protein
MQILPGGDKADHRGSGELVVTQPALDDDAG